MLLYCFINLNKDILIDIILIDTYFSSGIPLLSSVFSALAVFKLFCDEAFVILSEISLSIKSPVAAAAFWIVFFEADFIASVVCFLALSKSFWLYLVFTFLPIHLANYTNQQPFTYIRSLRSIE